MGDSTAVQVGQVWRGQDEREYVVTCVDERGEDGGIVSWHWNGDVEAVGWTPTRIWLKRWTRVLRAGTKVAEAPAPPPTRYGVIDGKYVSVRETGSEREVGRFCVVSLSTRWPMRCCACCEDAHGEADLLAHRCGGPKAERGATRRVVLRGSVRVSSTPIGIDCGPRAAIASAMRTDTATQAGNAIVCAAKSRGMPGVWLAERADWDGGEGCAPCVLTVPHDAVLTLGDPACGLRFEECADEVSVNVHQVCDRGCGTDVTPTEHWDSPTCYACTNAERARVTIGKAIDGWDGGTTNDVRHATREDFGNGPTAKTLTGGTASDYEGLFAVAPAHITKVCDLPPRLTDAERTAKLEAIRADRFERAATNTRPKAPEFRVDIFNSPVGYRPARTMHVKCCKGDIKPGDMCIWERARGGVGWKIHTMACGERRLRDAMRGYGDAMDRYRRRLGEASAGRPPGGEDGGAK